MLRLRTAGGLTAALFFLLSGTALARPPLGSDIPNDECLGCHAEVDEAEFKASIHGNHRCVSCHKGILETPHAETLPKVDCAACHRIETQIYNLSSHGKARAGGEPAASCKACHGPAHTLTDIRHADSPVNRPNIARMCAACHENTGAMERYHLTERQPFTSYLTTIHGKAFERGNVASATCTDCHGSHDLHPPVHPESKMNRLNVTSTCGKCHENVMKTYRRSVHGKANAEGGLDAPVCTDCHGEHTILSRTNPASSVYPSSVSGKVCASCHAAEKIVSKYHLPPDRVRTYMESYHGLASRLGVQTVANCASCHGVHDILPSNDPSSSVNKRNLVQTCGKCHPNVTERLAQGTVHTLPSTRSSANVAYWIRIFYLFLIPLTVGGMLLHNALDFGKKLKAHYRRKRAAPGRVRFTRSEMIQHAVLTGSFVLLAYSGFALRYQDAWWALPFMVKSGFDWRGTLHRAAAFVFCALALYHLGYLLFSSRGREQTKALRLSFDDARDALGTVLYNLGRRPSRPRFGKYGYVEKIEYWALVWGTAIMILTGALLLYENWTMRYFPKWLIDAAGAVHFYEAVLATLAILVWHLYFTVFDPEHYPMNLSMLTGKEEEKDIDDKG